jgi:hypothetical protein
MPQLQVKVKTIDADLVKVKKQDNEEDDDVSKSGSVGAISKQVTEIFSVSQHSRHIPPVRRMSTGCIDTFGGRETREPRRERRSRNRDRGDTVKFKAPRRRKSESNMADFIKNKKGKKPREERKAERAKTKLHSDIIEGGVKSKKSKKSKKSTSKDDSPTKSKKENKRKKFDATEKKRRVKKESLDNVMEDPMASMEVVLKSPSNKRSGKSKRAEVNSFTTKTSRKSKQEP